jgi:multidrug resistance protein, MATE family
VCNDKKKITVYRKQLQFTYSLALQPLMSAHSAPLNLQVNISYRQILKIALPISASIVVPQINFITNNIFLGGLGTQALALGGITGVYYLVLAVIGNGFNSGLQSLIARRAGESKFDEIGSLFAQGVFIVVVMSLFGMLLTWFIAPIILGWAMKDTNNVSMAVNFLNIRVLGLPFLYLYQLRNAVLVGTNQSKYLVIGTAIEAVTNVFFDYGFIYGKFGLPQLGFNGAAYASIIAEVAGLVSIFFVVRNNDIIKQLNLFKRFIYNHVNTKLILKQSLPLVLQFAISIISWEFFYILIEHHGSKDLAISNTMRNIFGFFGCFTWAFAATTTTMVSNVIGQGLQHRVVELLHKIIHLSVGFAATVCIFLNVFPNLFLSIYGQGNDFIQSAIPVLRVVSTALVIMSVSVVWLNALVGMGKTKLNLLIEMAAIIFYCLYVYFVLEKWNLSIMYGWASEWLYWIIMLVPAYFYIKVGKWKTKQMIVE